MKFMHIADVHLGVRPDRGRVWSDDRANEIEESFRDVLRICEDQEVDLLLIAGDLFHSQPTISQLRSLDYWLHTLPKTKTIIITGNHDYISEDSAWKQFEFSSDTVLLPADRATNAYIKELNVCVTGYSYGRLEYTERILERLRPGKEGAYNILLGHGGDKTHMPFSKEKLARLGFDYIALGHIHKPAHILKNKMAFSGSLEPIDYTETGRRGYIMGEVDNEGNTRIQWIAHNVRSYVNLALTIEPEYSNAQIADIVEKRIVELGKQHIYRILLKGTVDSNLQINLSGLTKRYNINEILDHTQADYDVDELFAQNENNLLGRFIQALSDDSSTEDEDIRSKAMRYGIDALLAAGDR